MEAGREVTVQPAYSAAWIGGVIIPTYRHIAVLPDIVAEVRAAKLPVIIIDDGNAADIAIQIDQLHDPAGEVRVVRRESNGGKGAAVKTGLREAAEAGWTHAIQIDADGQHDLAALADLVAASRDKPEAMICGVPRYDETVPGARKAGRYITHVWVWIETFSREISDSMCGFRAYPLADAVAVLDREMLGDRMDFDTEILVHMHWRGVPFIDVPVGVAYPENNVSNFRMLKDNVAISLMHTRLAVQMPVRAPIRWWRRRRRTQPRSRLV